MISRIIRLVSLLTLILLLTLPAAAFDLKQADIRIQPSGDAIITLQYDDNPAEYLGIKAFAASPHGAMEKIFGPALTKQGEALPLNIECAEAGNAQVTVPGFADKNGNTYTTPELALGNAAAAALQQQSGYQLDVTTDVVIVFPDGYTSEQKGTSTIRSITHTVASGKAYDPPAAPLSCSKKKDLPLSGIIPDEAMPVAAATAGAAATAAGVSLFGSTLSMWIAKIATFVQNAVGQVLQGRLSDKEKEGRMISGAFVSGTVLGISTQELGVISVGAVIIGVLFFFAERIPLSAETLAIYIVMGGIALAAHEIAHWYLNRKYRATTEVQLWGVGTLIMAFTAWLFGSVFAQPTLTLVYTGQPLDKKSLALIMLSGPVLSLIVALLCLCLVPLGGLFRTAGMIGFSINLLTAVFEMLPIPPCDGRVVYEWNKAVWAVVFVPLLLLYFVVNL